MYYRDLVQFDPIESIIQLRDADVLSEAQHLVRTYVISDRMAEQLTDLVIPQLQIRTPHDNKGVLVVGNYGTGKSHLMSVLSAVAEYPECVPLLNHPTVRAAAESIGGQFKVVRTEVGGVTGSLRDMLFRDLEEALAAWGTPYTFPPADQVTNNKGPLIEAVQGFRQRYPDQGILLVVDELLDYLRTREERALILDLGFLRELGEVCKATPFRFLAGVQETLFDNPRFAFVAQQLRRVRDRFEQVRIAREDIAYVVAHRLLKKDDAQLAWISEHLRQFAPLYGRLAERLDEFTRLFPIHPAYIETFERVYVAEKREVLRTFSQAMRALLDQDVPADRPGLISYDHYWELLRENPSMRSLPEVSAVIDKSQVLEGRVQHAYTRPHLQALAQRLVHALSVQRLTTGDIRAKLGVTAEELRDGLCLYTPMPEYSAEFLLDQVQVALREIMRTVSGQYITFNAENGQYYLDVDKDVDFAAKIAERGEFMEDDDLNRYCFEALQQLLHMSDTTYVSGYRIWPYELPWAAQRVTRPGYFFFGPPDERSTAQPPRDFYLYILPPYLQRAWQQINPADEVIFVLTGLDVTFREKVRLYAGARALALESSQYRQQYAEEADKHARTLLQWLREHLIEHLHVTYQGVTEPVRTVLGRLRSTASQNLEDVFRLVAADLLAPYFEEQYPEYPAFTRLDQPITEASREPSASEAIRYLAGRGRTNLALAVLEGLQVVDAEGNLRPYDSPYAQHLLDLLQRKAQGQVVNYGEVLAQVSGGLKPIYKDLRYALEPEWIAVVLVALVAHGDIVLNLGNEELDAGSVERAALRALVDLTDFRFYKRPKELPLNLWLTIFEGLGLAPGLMRDENARAEALKGHFLPLVNRELDQTATLLGQVQQGIWLWNEPLFTDRLTTITEEAGAVTGIDQPAIALSSLDLLAHLRGYKRFLEELARYNTVGKLRNLKLTLKEVQDSLADRKAVAQIKALADAVVRLQPLAGYLAEAQANLPPDHPWNVQAEALRGQIVEELRRFGRGDESLSAAALQRRLETAKQEYLTAYAALHRQLRLGPQADERRQKLYRDPRLDTLKTLARLDLFKSGREVESWQRELTDLLACSGFYEGVLDATPTCPHCHLRPSQQRARSDGETLLDDFDARLDALLTGWRGALRDALQSDAAQVSLAAMTPAERAPIDAFLAQANDAVTLPDNLVDVANQALRGITAVTLAGDGLLDALKEGGMPCTMDELRRRFEVFVDDALRGYAEQNTRVVLE